MLRLPLGLYARYALGQGCDGFRGCLAAQGNGTLSVPVEPFGGHSTTDLVFELVDDGQRRAMKAAPAALGDGPGGVWSAIAVSPFWKENLRMGRMDRRCLWQASGSDQIGDLPEVFVG